MAAVFTPNFITREYSPSTANRSSPSKNHNLAVVEVLESVQSPLLLGFIPVHSKSRVIKLWTDGDENLVLRFCAYVISVFAK